MGREMTSKMTLLQLIVVSSVVNFSSHALKPNAFVSIRISSSVVRESVARVQQIMLHRDSKLKSTFVSIDKLHLTLLVLRLVNKEKEKTAMRILCDAAHSISRGFRIDIKGVGNFSDQVVYFKIVQDKLLADMAAIVRHNFKTGGFPSMDSRNFTAHLSVAIVHKGSTISSIPFYTYANLENTYFGSDNATMLELLSMDRPTGRDGYYYKYGQCSLKAT